MYAFTDTLINETEDTSLPAEAVKFNRVQLDEAVPYFRTLAVTGRELMEAEIDSYSVDSSIGEYFRNRQVGTRTIEVRFQVIAPTCEAYRETFNILNGYLQAEEAQLIFADESDKYFIASASDVSNPEEGLNSGIGTITFTCSDPRKYALTKRASQQPKTVTECLRQQ